MRLFLPEFELRAWLYRVTTNLCFNNVRDKRRRATLGDPPVAALQRSQLDARARGLWSVLDGLAEQPGRALAIACRSQRGGLFAQVMRQPSGKAGLARGLQLVRHLGGLGPLA